LERNLRDIRRINALLGWTAFTSRAIIAWMRREPGRAWTLLDVASGSADIPIAIAHSARRAGIALEITATDRSPQITAIARERGAGVPNLRVETQDALALPYATGSFDIALCTLALHHFDPEPACALLRSLARVGRQVFVYDVVRSPLAYAGVVALTRIAGMSPMTRHDGAASVRRAYSLAEARALAAAAGLRNIQAYVRFPYRLSLTADGVATAGGGTDAL
ncbi:MAG TPA: methyltransferase domain-containing protein, partial [Ktedonobacterales bacterium]|nr:methyltransferase domain-containing protein [Ktedonobacterales bacterium]